jgi:hypothetical protein
MQIRKFNENIEKLDIDYIRDCFIDFIDRGNFSIKESVGFYDLVIRNSRFVKPILVNRTIEKLIENNIKILDKQKSVLNEFYLDIKNSIDKIKISNTITYEIKIKRFDNKVYIRIFK